MPRLEITKPSSPLNPFRDAVNELLRVWAKEQFAWKVGQHVADSTILRIPSPIPQLVTLVEEGVDECARNLA